MMSVQQVFKDLVHFYISQALAIRNIYRPYTKIESDTKRVTVPASF